MAFNAKTNTFVADENPASFVNGSASSFNPTAVTPSQVPLNQTNNAIAIQQPQAALAITPQSLQQTPQLKLPTLAPDTTSAGVVSAVQPSVAKAEDNYNQVKSATGNQAEQEQKSLIAMAKEAMGMKSSIQANQVALENQLGLQEQQKALSEINTEIATEQVALRGEQEKLRQSFASEGQKQISNNTLNDTYGRRLADLAIRQAAANQNITAIQSNADRQTKLLTAPIDTQIQYLSTFGKDNVDYLSSKEKEKLNFLQDDLKTQKADIQALQKAKTDMLIEIAKNGGGSNQQLIQKIQNAQGIGEVTTLGAGSGYIGALDRAQLAIAQGNLALSRARFSLESQQSLNDTQGVVPGQKPTGKADPQASGYATRAVAASNTINDLTKNATSIWSNANTSASNFFKSANTQKVEQAQKNFITAVLRKESGASISPEEFSTARELYFPLPGDKQDTVALKAQARVDALNGLIGSAGKAYNGTFLSSPYTAELSVQTPDGQTYTFATQSELNNFKKQANIK